GNQGGIADSQRPHPVAGRDSAHAMGCGGDFGQYLSHGVFGKRMRGILQSQDMPAPVVVPHHPRKAHHSARGGIGDEVLVFGDQQGSSVRGGGSPVVRGGGPSRGGGPGGASPPGGTPQTPRPPRLGGRGNSKSKPGPPLRRCRATARQSELWASPNVGWPRR